MKKNMVFMGILAFLFIAACGGSSGKTLVDVNGEKITESYLKFLGEINPRIQAQMDSPAGQKRILDNLVEQELMYSAAVKEGINRDPKVKEKIDLYRRVIIAQALVEDATEKAAKKYYDEHQDEFKKLKLSDIAIKFATPDEIKKAKKGEKMKTEQEALKVAQDAKALIDKGDEFAKVAGEFSDDAATKARGGDQGLVSKGDKRMETKGMGPVVDKAFELKVGEVAGPIKTDKGYHIITVTRGVELEPFDEAKQGVLFKVRNETRDALLAKLKKDAKVVFPEEEKQQAEAKKKAEEQARGEAKVPEAAKAPVVEEGQVPAPAPEEKK